MVWILEKNTPRGIWVFLLQQQTLHLGIFTTTTNTSATINSAEATTFFEQQSTHSSTVDIIKVSSGIIVDMDESITSRSAFY